MELTEVNALNMTLRGSRVCEEKGRRGRGERRRRSRIDFRVRSEARALSAYNAAIYPVSRISSGSSWKLEMAVVGAFSFKDKRGKCPLGTSFIARCSFKSALCGRSGFMSGSIHSTQHGTLPKSAPSSLLGVSAPFRSLIRLSIARARQRQRGDVCVCPGAISSQVRSVFHVIGRNLPFGSSMEPYFGLSKDHCQVAPTLAFLTRDEEGFIASSYLPTGLVSFFLRVRPNNHRCSVCCHAAIKADNN